MHRDELCDKIFEELSKIEKVRTLNSKEKKAFGFKSDNVVWEVDTEISYNDQLLILVIHVVITSEFPLEFPKIYLSPETYNQTKFIPHVDSRRFVCTFDTEVACTNPEEPTGIVLETIKKAKTIISDGLHGVNIDDFKEEFKAYWENKYDNEKNSPNTILSLIDRIYTSDTIKLISLEKKVGGFYNILHRCDDITTRFKTYLDFNKLKYQEFDVFYLGDFNEHQPPFEYKNLDILKIVQKKGGEHVKKFKVFINRNKYPLIVICTKQLGDKEYIFGMHHGQLNINRNGFRPNTLKPFQVFSTFQSHEYVDRISTETFTPERLENRSSGYNTPKHEKSFLIAGVGSIGSNLVYFLNSMDSPQFKIIDKDKLQIENIKRHLLGFEHVGKFKTEAIKDYILNKNPLQKVCTRRDSIIDIVLNEEDFLNSSDYIFVSIGKNNIDDWLCTALSDGLILKPMFIIWVEPYLCGGHCIYLHPSDSDHQKFYENELFKFNVIDSEEYINTSHKFSLKEAGCQTSFIPYSGSNVVSFLSAVFPVIKSVIDNQLTKSSSFTWLGNIDILNDKQIKISKYYKNKKNGTLIKHEL